MQLPFILVSARFHPDTALFEVMLTVDIREIEMMSLGNQSPALYRVFMKSGKEFYVEANKGAKLETAWIDQIARGF